MPSSRTATRKSTRNAAAAAEAFAAEWRRLLAALADALISVIFIYGRPGVGKTHAAYHHGRIGGGLYAVTLTEETSAAELRGHFIFVGGDALWHDGPFVRAMREGARLVINELRYSSADVMALLFPILEDVSTARLTLPTGETVTPAEGFHVVITDNEPPDDFHEALQDRFHAVMRVSRPHPEAFEGLDPALRRAAEKALDIEDERRISARGWNNLQRLFPKYGLEEACAITFGPDRGAMVYQALRLSGDVPAGSDS